MGLVRCCVVVVTSILFKKHHIDLLGESVSTIPSADIHVYERDANTGMLDHTYQAPVGSFNGPGTLLRCIRHFNFI